LIIRFTELQETKAGRKSGMEHETAPLKKFNTRLVWCRQGAISKKKETQRFLDTLSYRLKIYHLEKFGTRGQGKKYS